MRHGEVVSVGELRRRLDRTLGANDPAPLQLDVVTIPEAVRHLVPWAERFGIADDAVRSEVPPRSGPPRPS